MKQIGRYEVIGRLGQGGMSTVYKARAPITGRIVALKILKPRNEIFVDLVGLEKLKEIFLEEARIMGAISHEHIAKVIDCNEHEGMPFIVLEYYGHVLGAIIGEQYVVEEPSRPLGNRRVYKYLMQILRGLERLHFAGVVHRDIKPFNLMLTDDDRIKIIDFGLSRVRGEEKMSIPGMQVGSPHYAAPEQERSPEKADARADIFSVGVMAYRMLTGLLPVWEKRVVAPPSQINNRVSTSWDLFVLKSVARNPEDRFVDASTMMLALREVYDDLVSSKDGLKNSKVMSDVERVDLKLRVDPMRIMYKDIRKSLELDELMRPKSLGHNIFDGDKLVAHHKGSGIIWQRRGAGFPLSWVQAKEYVQQLNKQQWQGRNHWRLPTTEEVCSVLEPLSREHLLEPFFSQTIHWLWTGDYCTKKQAWMADVVDQYIERLAMDSTASVCAVCSV